MALHVRDKDSVDLLDIIAKAEPIARRVSNLAFMGMVSDIDQADLVMLSALHKRWGRTIDTIMKARNS